MTSCLMYKMVQGHCIPSTHEHFNNSSFILYEPKGQEICSGKIKLERQMDHYQTYAMQGLENTLENELDRHIKIKQSFSKQNVFPSLTFLHDCKLQLLDSHIMQQIHHKKTYVHLFHKVNKNISISKISSCMKHIRFFHLIYSNNFNMQ